jgi:hypothetical protein
MRSSHPKIGGEIPLIYGPGLNPPTRNSALARRS